MDDSLYHFTSSPVKIIRRELHAIVYMNNIYELTRWPSRPLLLLYIEWCHKWKPAFDAETFASESFCNWQTQGGGISDIFWETNHNQFGLTLISKLLCQKHKKKIGLKNWQDCFHTQKVQNNYRIPVSLFLKIYDDVKSIS